MRRRAKKPKNGGVGQWPGCLSQDFQGGAKNKPKIPQQKPRKRTQKTDSIDKESRKEKRNEALRKRKKKLH